MANSQKQTLWNAVNTLLAIEHEHLEFFIALLSTMSGTPPETLQRLELMRDYLTTKLNLQHEFLGHGDFEDWQPESVNQNVDGSPKT